MKQLEVVTKITVRWWLDDREIPDEHLEHLEEHGRDRAIQMIKSGYTSGELREEMTDDAGNNIEHSGWWELDTQVGVGDGDEEVNELKEADGQTTTTD